MGKEFEADYDGVDPQEGGGAVIVVPPGKYLAKIVSTEPGMSSNKNPMVTVDWEIVEPSDWRGTPIKFQNVTFLPKTHDYAGISLGFLKNIRQPYKGKFKIRPDEWRGKHAHIHVEVEEFYSEKHKRTFERNKVTRTVSPSAQELIDLGEVESVGQLPEWLRPDKADNGDKEGSVWPQGAPKGGQPSRSKKGEEAPF